MPKFLTYRNIIGGETRLLFFYKALGLEIPVARIISFGDCNFNCPYCKRMGHFKLPNGVINKPIIGSFEEIEIINKDAIAKGQIVRLSGGDPVMFPAFSLKIAKSISQKNGRLSLAHNGSSPEFISRIAPFLESAAIDLKSTPDNMSAICGISDSFAKCMYYRSIECQRILLQHDVLLDVRTPIFRFTTIDDLFFIANDLNKIAYNGKLFWTLRCYDEVVGCQFQSPEIENVIWMSKEIQKQYKKLSIGIRCKWVRTKFIYI